MQRDTMVDGKLARLSVVIIMMVLPGGSSSVFSIASAAGRAAASKFDIIATRRFVSIGFNDNRWTSSRTASMLIFPVFIKLPVSTGLNM